jgi:large subunit ribosomal protein L2
MRVIDFRRDKLGISGKVVSTEYDPNRTSEIALIQYADGEKRYILRPQGLNLGDAVKSGSDAEVKPGNTLQLNAISIGTFVHNVELTPGTGGQLARTAGSSAQVMAREGGFVHLKLPSGEIRKVRGECFATVGALGNIDWKNKVIGKAGRKRNMGIRPTVRGVAQNPRSHPHGGGEGRSGIGMTTPKTYAGRKAVGKTRKKKKYSDKYIIQRRKK